MEGKKDSKAGGGLADPLGKVNKMLKKKVNIKGLRKKLLSLEYGPNLRSGLGVNHSTQSSTVKPLGGSTEAFTSAKEKTPSNSTRAPLGIREAVPGTLGTYRVLILRSAPLSELTLKALNSLADPLRGSRRSGPCVESGLPESESGKSSLISERKVVGKCIKKTVLKKTILKTVIDPLRKVSNSDQQGCVEGGLTGCKYIYWMTPVATSLKEQLIQFSRLREYIKAEPKENFLGCLIESPSACYENTSVQTDQGSGYKYYYPAQMWRLCDTLERCADNLGGAEQITGLELFGQLLNTLDASVNSMSVMLALKKAKLPSGDQEQK